MDENRDLIARRIRGLQAKTVENGCTEQEAMLAAEKIGQLMAQYRLTQTDLEFQEEPIEKREVDRRQEQKQVSEDSCLSGIQRYCGVKAWYTTHLWPKKTRKLVLFGKRADCDHAEWLYKMIGPTIMSAAEGYKAAMADEFRPMTMVHRRRAYLDFRMGMALRINARLIEMAKALEPTAKTGSGTALVVLRTALVDAAYAELNLKLTKGSSRRFRGGDAYARGAAAGDRVNLNRPVGSTTRGILQ